MTIDTETLRSASKRNDVYKSAMQGLLAWAADSIDAQAAEIAQARKTANYWKAERNAANDEIARLREALTAIEQWEVPLVESRGEAVSMSVAYGSNGVRDYFRGVARAALSGEANG